jgi:hypothetical protein
MPEPAESAVESLPAEILAPTRFSCHRTFVCDCCRQKKSEDEFDEDALGICAECLESDAILVELVARFEED